MLTFVLLLPVMFLVGVGESGGAAGGEGDAGVPDGDKSGDMKDKKGDEKAGDKAGEKTFTQADVDRIVKERLARETKKQADSKQQSNNASTGDDQKSTSGAEGDKAQKGNDEALAKATLMVETAKATLLMATAQTEAIKLGVDPKYVADVVRLADMSKIEVDETMKVDANAIAKALDEVVKRVPAFKATVDNQSGFRIGGGNAGQQTNNGWNQQKPN